MSAKTTKLQSEVRSWMWAHLYSEDPDMGPTRLAEAAADAFDSDEWLDDETHFVWDLAFEITEANEA